MFQLLPSCWNIGFIFYLFWLPTWYDLYAPYDNWMFLSVSSDQNIPSSFLCRVVLLCINYFIMFYYRKFLSLSILIGKYAGCIDLCWQYWPFRTLRISFLAPKVLKFSVKQSDVILLWLLYRWLNLSLLQLFTFFRFFCILIFVL